jgi:amino acid transporter
MTKSEEVYVRKASGLIRAVSSKEALIFNLVGMGIVINIFWIYWASAAYPDANLVVTTLTTLPLNAIFAYTYWMLSTAMPRTGGDYIYVSRILHPSLGFATNFVFFVIMMSWIGWFPAVVMSEVTPILLANLGIVTGDKGYFSLAQSLSTNMNLAFIFSVIIVILVTAIMLYSPKAPIKVALAIFAYCAFAYIWFIALNFMYGYGTFATNLQTIWNVNASDVVNLVQQKMGHAIAFSTEGTAIGLVYTMMSYIGYANSSYYASEVSGKPEKSQALAIFGSAVIFSFIIFLLYSSMYYAYSHEFLVAASWLSVNGDPAYTLPAIPSPAHLAVFLHPDLITAVLIPSAVALTMIGFAITYFYTPIRMLFAWAFDRIFPSWVTGVTSRGVPRNAIIIGGVVGIISAYLNIYTKVLAYISYANFGWWIAVAVVELCGAVFPFVRKDIFEASPGIVKIKAGGIPLISIISAIGIPLSLWVSYSTILPSFTGFPIEPIYVVSMLFVFIGAFIYWWLAYLYQKRRGIPMELLRKTLPPL